MGLCCCQIYDVAIIQILSSWWNFKELSLKSSDSPTLTHDVEEKMIITLFDALAVAGILEDNAK
jgi:hypothetical protein